MGNPNALGDPQHWPCLSTSMREFLRHRSVVAWGTIRFGLSNLLQLRVAARSCFRAVGAPLACADSKQNPFLLITANYALRHNRRLRGGVFCVSVSHGGTCCPRSSQYCSVVASPRCEPTEGLTLHEGFVQAITHSH